MDGVKKIKQVAIGAAWHTNSRLNFRNVMCLLLCVMLIGTSAMCGFAAEDAEADATAVAPVYTLVFTGEAIQMSLEDAMEKMLTDSVEMEAAIQTRMANQAKTRSYYENEWVVNALVEMRSSGSFEDRQIVAATPVSISRESQELVAYLSNFATAQTPRNFDAAVNQIMRDTVQRYYELAQAKELLRISQENVAIQERLYQNTQSRFELGVAARQDVLRAEIALNEAVVSAQAMENAYTLGRMNYNRLIGLDLMQNVALTDALEEQPMSTVPLSEAVSGALANRNEILATEFGEKLAEYGLVQLRNRSRSTAAYRTAQADLTKAQNDRKNAPIGIEMEVKGKYMHMVQKKSEVELGKLNVENAKETYRLANLQYEVGMTTLAEAQLAQINAYRIELAYYGTLLEYNLAIIDYEQSMTVGTMSIPF